MTDPDPYRLSHGVRPRHYDLTLAPDLEAGTFTGEVAIDLDIAEATDRFWCNGIDLAIGRATLEVAGHTVDLRSSVEPATERVRFDVPQRCAPGPARLRVGFSGVLIEQLRGFYRSTFTDPSGTARDHRDHAVPGHRRTPGVPCWDEPEHKATFAITLDIADDLLAVSNGRSWPRHRPPDGRRRVRFATTMKMSTYLVAFVIGPLEATEPVDVDGIPVRVVHTPGNADLTSFALESAAFALRYFARLLRHRLPGRQTRPCRGPRLRVRRDGEPRVRHLPRNPPSRRSGNWSRNRSCNGSPTSSITSSHTCGSATSSPCAGGTASG